MKHSKIRILSITNSTSNAITHLSLSSFLLQVVLTAYSFIDFFVLSTHSQIQVYVAKIDNLFHFYYCCVSFFFISFFSITETRHFSWQAKTCLQTWRYIPKWNKNNCLFRNFSYIRNQHPIRQVKVIVASISG